MARLNESTAPAAESIDILKRRFVRQNREIARVNSIQSLRIRSLESEVSHLLSENVSLREQIISLNQEVERFEAARLLQDGVYDLKAKLDSKLAEINNLVSDLGSLPRKVGKLPEERPQSTDQMHERISNLEARRRAGFDCEPALDDGKLPVIMEDKYYPRRTLESQEVQELIDDSNRMESPDLEEEVPVPQLSFEYNLSPTPRSPVDVVEIPPMEAQFEDDENLLPPTLETRKKKKRSPVAVEEKAFDTKDNESPISPSDPKYTLKSGSKRKFNSEEDDRFSPLPAGDDDFQFSRPTQVSQKSDEQFVSIRGDTSPVKRQVEVKRGAGTKGSSKRKVLEPKSTNLNMASPKKFRVANRDEDKKPQNVFEKGDENQQLPSKPSKESINKERKDSNRKRSSNVRQIERQTESTEVLDEPEAENKVNELPELPALQPQQSEPEPAPDAGRASRRRGAVVSYAEPNLRDKMRRPGKQLADAVNSRRVSSCQPARDADGESEGVSSKRSSMKSRPSDTTDKGSGFQSTESLDDSRQSLSMVSQRKRKTLPARDNLSDELSGTDTEAKPSDMDRERAGDDRLQFAMEKEFSTRPTSKQSRRHSSNPRSFGKETLLQDDDSSNFIDEEEAEDAAMDIRPSRRGQRTTTRRKSMMV